MLAMGVLRMGRWRREMELGLCESNSWRIKSLQNAIIYHVDSGAKYQ
jgi:hypothetical protein